MTTTIDFTYNYTSEESRMMELQRKIRVAEELIEEFEGFRGNPEVTNEEIDEAIAEQKAIIEKAEEIIFKWTWNIA